MKLFEKYLKTDDGILWFDYKSFMDVVELQAGNPRVDHLKIHFPSS